MEHDRDTPYIEICLFIDTLGFLGGSSVYLESEACTAASSLKFPD